MSKNTDAPLDKVQLIYLRGEGFYGAYFGIQEDANSGYNVVLAVPFQTQAYAALFMEALRKVLTGETEGV